MATLRGCSDDLSYQEAPAGQKVRIQSRRTRIAWEALLDGAINDKIGARKAVEFDGARGAGPIGAVSARRRAQ